MRKINLGLDNQALYDGCEVVEVNGQLRLAVVPNIVEIIDNNVTKIIDSVPIDQRSKVTLTGSVENWLFFGQHSTYSANPHI